MVPVAVPGVLYAALPLMVSPRMRNHRPCARSLVKHRGARSGDVWSGLPRTVQRRIGARIACRIMENRRLTSFAVENADGGSGRDAAGMDRASD